MQIMHGEQMYQEDETLLEYQKFRSGLEKAEKTKYQVTISQNVPHCGDCAQCIVPVYTVIREAYIFYSCTHVFSRLAAGYAVLCMEHVCWHNPTSKHYYPKARNNLAVLGFVPAW